MVSSDLRACTQSTAGKYILSYVVLQTIMTRLDFHVSEYSSWVMQLLNTRSQMHRAQICYGNVYVIECLEVTSPSRKGNSAAVPTIRHDLPRNLFSAKAPFSQGIS